MKRPQRRRTGTEHWERERPMKVELPGTLYFLLVLVVFLLAMVVLALTRQAGYEPWTL